MVYKTPILRNVLQNNKNNKEVSESLHTSLRHSEVVQSEIQNLEETEKLSLNLYIKLKHLHN